MTTEPSTDTVDIHGETFARTATRIRLKNLPVASLQEVSGFPELEKLELIQGGVQVRVSEIPPGLELPKLHTLSCYSSRIGSLENLAQFPELRSIALEGNRLQELVGLELPKLEYLWVPRNMIRRVGQLDGLPSLRTLNLASNPLSGRVKLGALPALETLLMTNVLWVGHAEDAELAEIFSGLPALTQLNLNETGLSKIPDLGSMRQLERLELGGGQITEIRGLEGLQHLHTLSLHRNRLEAIDGLAGLTSLKNLVLRNNRIDTIGPLDGLVRLERLLIYGNRLTRLQHLEALPALRELQIHGNPLAEISQASFDHLCAQPRITVEYPKPSTYCTPQELVSKHGLEVC
jgi:internalin A